MKNLISVVERFAPYVLLVIGLYVLGMFGYMLFVISEFKYRPNPRQVYEINSSKLDFAYYELSGGLKIQSERFVYKDSNGNWLAISNMPNKFKKENFKALREKLIFIYGDNTIYPENKILMDNPLHMVSMKSVIKTRIPLKEIKDHLKAPTKNFNGFYNIETFSPIQVEFKEIVINQGGIEYKYQADIEKCPICHEKNFIEIK